MLRSKRHTLSHNSKGFHSFHSVPATVKPSAPSEFRAAFTVQEETWSEYDSYICSSLTKTKHDNCGHVTSVWTVGSEFTCLLQFVVTAVEWFGGEKSETFRCIRKKRLKKNKWTYKDSDWRKTTTAPGECWDQSRQWAVHDAKYSISSSYKILVRYIWQHHQDALLSKMLLQRKKLISSWPYCV